MRPILLGLAASVVLACGCRSAGPTAGIPTSSVEGSARDDAVRPASAQGETAEAAEANRAHRLFSRTGVPDSLMLQNQPETGYRDSPVPY